MTTYEVNFDGLVGPTHNYAGLSFGNVASLQHARKTSNPKAAAKQGLHKMRAIAELGLPQGILPPHERPHIPTLRRLGFSGANDTEILQQAARTAPEILANCLSASPMWVANAATVSPKYDTADARTHFTVANLSNMFHRSLEHEVTSRIMRRIFADEQRFVHHHSLPMHNVMGDEGAANHTRFCARYDKPGVELFVFGGYALRPDTPKPKKYPARQTFEAVQSIARLHGLSEQHTVFAQQNPAAIDGGVFHNDVISVGNLNTLFYHELAFLNTEKVIAEINSKLVDAELQTIRVDSADVTLEEAVNSYLFNTQLIQAADTNGNMRTLLIAPTECQEIAAVANYLTQLVESTAPIDEVKFFNLRESMQNGGGPACLRLRVVLSEDDRAHLGANVLLNDSLFEQLNQWIDKHYRDRLPPEDIMDPQLLDECHTALDKLTQLLNLGAIYDFQR